jgi:hypothetical protein
MEDQENKVKDLSNQYLILKLLQRSLIFLIVKRQFSKITNT